MYYAGRPKVAENGRVYARAERVVWRRVAGVQNRRRRGGEILRLRRVAGPIKIGDIVLHRSVSRGSVRHRIHGIRGGTFEIIGDNLLKRDGAVGIHAVIAVADAIRLRD